MQYTGEAAALMTAFCWVGSSLFFTNAGRQVGSMVVNRMRLVMAVFLLMTAHAIILGQIIPLDAGAERWFWLGASGIVGLVFGDAALFQAFVLIGPRLTTLIMSLVPVISALIAWVFLGERLGLLETTGILIAVTGIAAVVSERGNGGLEIERKQYLAGVLFGFLGAVGQAVGMVLAKRGLTGDFSALSGVLLRMLTAMVVLWLFTLLRRQARATVKKVSAAPRALRSILGGSIAGPFLGVWMSLIAIQSTYVGIASTLMALTPIIMLPVVKWGFKERVSRWAVGGTLVSLTGVAIIFLAA
jgi:drug/metabolite transporter (DMT)-like permease